MFEDGSCREGTHGSPLSLERDRRGGINGRLAGHEVRKVFVDAVVEASCGTCRWKVVGGSWSYDASLFRSRDFIRV